MLYFAPLVNHNSAGTDSSACFRRRIHNTYQSIQTRGCHTEMHSTKLQSLPIKYQNIKKSGHLCAANGHLPPGLLEHLLHTRLKLSWCHFFPFCTGSCHCSRNYLIDVDDFALITPWEPFLHRDCTILPRPFSTLPLFIYASACNSLMLHPSVTLDSKPCQHLFYTCKEQRFVNSNVTITIICSPCYEVDDFFFSCSKCK